MRINQFKKKDKKEQNDRSRRMWSL